MKATGQPQQTKVRAKLPEKQVQMNHLPPEMLADLQECFNHYLEEGEFEIPDHLFRNILQNFGFHRMGPRDIEDELKKTDPNIQKANSFSFDFVKAVVTYRWHKGSRGEAGKDEEAKECWKLFDKRDRGFTTASDIKPVLADNLPFPPSDQDVIDFIAECDKTGSGHVTF